MPDWETVIGLEVHAQLKTQTKMFCGCRVEFGAPPNTHVCPVCLGLPGALPVTNGCAVELAVLAALALECRVHPRSVFARKNYFYPDLPKGYQISQYDRPIATGGVLQVRSDDAEPASEIRIRRLHLEEDAGKSLHDRFPGMTAVDLNRAGTPLIEIVTEPDLRSPGQARTFLTRLKQTLEYLDVSDCNMEEGSLRVDANVSVRPADSRELSTKTEIKNMNSFAQLEKALEFESARHVRVLESGREIVHETMLWDAAGGEARPMRGKEEVHDYRYFADPDLPTLEVSAESIERARAELPELPAAKFDRFVAQYGLPAYDADVLSSSRGLADYYEAVVRSDTDPKTASNWVMGEVLAVCNDRALPVDELRVRPAELAELIARIDDGTLSQNLAKQVFRKMVDAGKTAEEIIEEENLSQVSDVEEIRSWVAAVVEEHPDEVERWRAGEEKLIGYFIGQVMRRSAGRADPARLREALLDALSERSG